MYKDNDYVYSGLVTGTMWDMTMKFITKTQDYSDLKNTTWGNYLNSILTMCEGRYLPVDPNSGSITSVATAASILNGKARYGILTTASTDETAKNNIYDLAGNLWELTQETCWLDASTAYYTIRGGVFNATYDLHPVCVRAYSRYNIPATHVGFRPALFMK